MSGSFYDKCLMKVCGRLPARLVLAALAFLGFVNQYIIRNNISIAIVAMVAPIAKAANGTRAGPECALEPATTVAPGTPTLEPELYDDRLEWDAITQGNVLASFYYGYAATQVIGGRLAEMFGSRWVFGGAILGSGLLNLLMPVAAKWHSAAFIALRVIMGLLNGGVWPAMHALLGQWIPPIERPRFIAAVYLGATLSVTFTFPMCAEIISNHGWEAVFYVSGSLSVIWGVAWFALMYDTPAHHPRISDQEREYINEAVAAGGSSRATKGRVPWRAMATSKHVWAIIVCDIGNSFGLTVYLAQLPFYMKHVLGFSLKENGMLSGLPFLSRYLGGLVASNIGDRLIASGKLSIVATRRIFSAIAMFGPAVMLLGVANTGCNSSIAVGLLCCSMFFNGSITTSQLVNHTDITPNFAGTLFGISNTFASITGFIAPLIVAFVTQGLHTQNNWSNLFYLCVGMYIITETFYLVFCSGTVQPWNYTEETEGGEEAGEMLEKEKKTVVVAQKDQA